MKIGEYISAVFFPQRCPHCGKVMPFMKNSCTCVGDEVRLISNDFCRHCGSERESCTCESKRGAYLDNIAGVYCYGGRIRTQIALYKFSGQKRLAKEFSLCMSERVAEVFSDINFDAVTFVPASEKSLSERGFNQSELLAKGVSERLFVPFEPTLRKVRETENQHTLTAKERTVNLDGAFGLADGASVKGKTLLLCDDIKTTGTTLRKCSDVLYENGAKEVYCIVLAVTDYMTDI